MGAQFSLSIRDYVHPEEAPRTDRPPTFDPLYGFPNGRKPREMKITWEEMEAAKLTPGERDYCAHLIAAFKACQRKYAPFAGHACASARQEYESCAYEDFLMRVKEYERERRLLVRKRRKELKAAEANASAGTVEAS